MPSAFTDGFDCVLNSMRLIAHVSHGRICQPRNNLCGTAAAQDVLYTDALTVGNGQVIISRRIKNDHYCCYDHHFFCW